MSSGKFLGPGEGESFVLAGIHVAPKVTADDSGATCSLIEQTVPHGVGMQPQICHRAEKAYYVVEGEFSIVLGEETKIAAAGACVVVPKGTVHGFSNIGESEGKLLTLVTPAGYERFLLGLSQLAHADPDPARTAALYEKHGVELI